MAVKELSPSEVVAAVLLVLFLTGSDGCLSGLPAFRNYAGLGLLSQAPPDNIQAIIPSYRFTCSGKVVEWGACFRPGAYFDRYNVSYQVWRERLPGCYYLVDSNSPQGTLNNLLTLGGRCNTTSIPPDEQITVQAGDVVGFYSDHWEEKINGALFNTHYRSGIQILTAGYNTTMFTSRLTSLQSMMTSYVVSTTPGSCASLTDFSGHEVNTIFMGAPVITAVIESEQNFNVNSDGESPGESTSSVTYTTSQELHHMTHHMITTTHHVTTTTLLFSISPSIKRTSTRGSITKESEDSTSATSSPLKTTLTSTSLLLSSPSTASPSSIDVTHTATPENSSGSSHDPYDTMVLAAAASLVVLFTILMVLVTILAIALYVRKKTGQRRMDNRSSPRPQLEFELTPARSPPDGGVDDAQILHTEYHLLNKSQDKLSVLSSGPYATSPVIGPRNEATGEGSSNDLKVTSRLKVDSMIYNGVYGSYTSIDKGASPLRTVQLESDGVYRSYSSIDKGASPLRTVQLESEQDCDGYELPRTTKS